jgi:hypothetical protein
MTLVELEGSVVDEQTFLDGTRELTVDAAETPSGAAAPWTLTLTCRWPKEPEAALDEGDLSLTRGDAAAIYATLRSGSLEPEHDEDTGDELVRVDLTFAAGSTEGAAADVTAVRLRGVLIGETARLTAEFEGMRDEG